jgi:hypothetical protein
LGYRVGTYLEHDGYRLGCRLSRPRRQQAAIGEDQGDAAVDEIGYQRGQAVILAVRPAVFDHDVLSFNKARFGQAFAISCDDIIKIVGSSRGNHPITGTPAFCARPTTGHAAALPSAEMKVRRRMPSSREP